MRTIRMEDDEILCNESDGILQFTDSTELRSFHQRIFSSFMSLIVEIRSVKEKQTRWLQNKSNLFGLTLAMQFITCAHTYSLENIV